MKKCYSCSIEKDLCDYHKDKSRPDGHRAICKECSLLKNKIYHRDNKSKIKERKSIYRDNNKETLLLKHKIYYKNNKDKGAARSKLRRARKLQALPVWADVKTIHSFYKEASFITETTGTIHHVDHIVPLRSKLVCGLHCEQNLQIIPAKENLIKSNCYWPDMPT